MVNESSQAKVSYVVTISVDVSSQDRIKKSCTTKDSLCKELFIHPILTVYKSFDMSIIVFFHCKLKVFELVHNRIATNNLQVL